MARLLAGFRWQLGMKRQGIYSSILQLVFNSIVHIAVPAILTRSCGCQGRGNFKAGMDPGRTPPPAYYNIGIGTVAPEFNRTLAIVCACRGATATKYRQ